MSSPADDEVAALFDLLKRRYGGRLAPDELDRVHEGVKLIVRTAEELRAFEIDNGTGPAVTFTPRRREG